MAYSVFDTGVALSGTDVLIYYVRLFYTSNLKVFFDLVSFL